MSITLGVLSDSYRRQLRRLKDQPVIDVVVEKVAAVARATDIGPIGIDFGVGALPSTDKIYLSELKTKFADLNMVPTVIIGTLGLHADQDFAGPPIEASIRNLEVANYLGSPLGLFYFSYGGRVKREGRIRIAVEQIGRLAEAARQFDMTVTTENYDFFTSDDFLHIFEQVGADNVGLHNDTGNWLILDENPLTATRKMADWTYHAHVRDYRIVDGVCSSVPIGMGDVDFPSVLAELRKAAGRRDRFVMAVEMDMDVGDAAAEDEAVLECARYMKKWLDTQG
ncbi:MAG: TIM barrel protein [Caldilineaceae bacterium]|nr:TIM barrel protein [Caldilineaceae bacterium]